MALASDIERLPASWFVGSRRPITDLPRLQRWLARVAYWRTGWASDYSVEGQAICTTEERADEIIAGRPNWFKQKLPINVSLPEENCKFELMTFPASEAAAGYDHRRAPFDAVPHRDVEALAMLDNKLGELQDCIEGKCVKAL